MYIFCIAGLASCRRRPLSSNVRLHMRPFPAPPVAAICLAALVMGAGVAEAQSDLERAKNLVTCYTGANPSLCKRSWLSAEEAEKANRAEHDANLKTCLTGKYPALCRKAGLSQVERGQVEQAERSANVEVCRTGRYPSLCKHGLLTPEQRTEVEAAELRTKTSTSALYAPPIAAPHSTNQGQYAAPRNSGGCGSRGGPGWRKPNGKCASWRD